MFNIKDKRFIIGTVVEAEICRDENFIPRQYFNSFLPGSGIWRVGSVKSIDQYMDSPELTVDFGSYMGTCNFPLNGHPDCNVDNWYKSGSLREYDSGSTRDSHCNFCSIIELGTVPTSSLDKEFYKKHFRRIVMNNWINWPTCKIEQKTLDIKYYLSSDNQLITGVFECQYCCF